MLNFKHLANPQQVVQAEAKHINQSIKSLHRTGCKSLTTGLEMFVRLSQSTLVIFGTQRQQQQPLSDP